MRGGGAKSVRVEGAQVALIVAPYYREVTEALLAGAQAALAAGGAQTRVFEVGGALEIPLAIAAIEEGRVTPAFDGYIGLGCVVRGETYHFEIVCTESARGLMELGLRGRFAVANGVLTVNDMEQALERADPARLNKGGEAAHACLSLIALKRARP